jgi:putative ABC transport system substrate-binding protein
VVGRRAFLVGVATVLARVSTVRGQTTKPSRVGLLSPGAGLTPRHETFRQALHTRGWTEGQNLVIEYRFGGDDYKRLRALAEELVRTKVDVIYAPTAPSALAAKEATRTIPIVFHTLNDPVRAGLVASLSRPGGNLTGNSGLGPELDRKRIELIKELIPSLSVVTVLVNPANVMTPPRLVVVEEAASAARLQVRNVEATDKKSLEKVLEAMSRNRPDGLIVFEDPLFSVHRRRIIEFALRERVIALYTQSGWAQEGGLIEYAPNQDQLIRQAAAYVDRILRGARPSELPVEQATKFDLVINLRAARKLNVDIPQPLLLRADQVIE